MLSIAFAATQVLFDYLAVCFSPNEFELLFEGVWPVNVGTVE